LQQAAKGSGGVSIPGGISKVQMWCLGTQFSGGLGSVRLMV